MLTDCQLSGNVLVTIKNDNAPGIEGRAFIKKIHSGDRQGVFADVEFQGEPGVVHKRWVFTSHQKN